MLLSFINTYGKHERNRAANHKQTGVYGNLQRKQTSRQRKKRAGGQFSYAYKADERIKC